ncbi:MAG: type II toxin-antitoxin system VapC family toxin [Deltaproteobacteria bacterium]|nr:type II toxin-antitoxin system VapC family toxin [Deltaproteobacteria bacterium]
MTPAVLDASFVAKLVFAERSSHEAMKRMGRLARTRTPLHAPELLHAEIVSISSRKVREGNALPVQARRLLELPAKLGIVFWKMEPFAGFALELTLAADVSAHDAVYLALAERVDGKVITADARLARALAGGPLEHRLELLDEV